MTDLQTKEQQTVLANGERVINRKQETIQLLKSKKWTPRDLVTRGVWVSSFFKVLLACLSSRYTNAWGPCCCSKENGRKTAFSKPSHQRRTFVHYCIPVMYIATYNCWSLTFVACFFFFFLVVQVLLSFQMKNIFFLAICYFHFFFSSFLNYIFFFYDDFSSLPRFFFFSCMSRLLLLITIHRL